MDVLEFLYPTRCPACDQKQPRESGLCAVCRESLYPTDAPFWRAALFDGVVEKSYAPFRYGGELALALRRLKYAKRPDIARTLAPLIRAPFGHAAAEADLVIPIPLHWRRQWVRSFNQAERLLYHAARGQPVKIDRRSLRRVRHTPFQARLPAYQRLANIVGAFRVHRRRHAVIGGRRVLLFDDVASTGATFLAAATALRAAGAAAVLTFSVARAD
jgi:ComF family protein